MPLDISADYEAKLPLFFRSCGGFSPKLWKNAILARDTGDVCSRFVHYPMPCCRISHALFHPISGIVLTYPMPCCPFFFSCGATNSVSNLEESKESRSNPQGRSKPSSSRHTKIPPLRLEVEGEGLRILVDRLHQNIKFWRDYFTSFKLLGTASNLPLPVTLYLIS